MPSHVFRPVHVTLALAVIAVALYAWFMREGHRDGIKGRGDSPSQAREPGDGFERAPRVRASSEPVDAGDAVAIAVGSSGGRLPGSAASDEPRHTLIAVSPETQREWSTELGVNGEFEFPADAREEAYRLWIVRGKAGFDWVLEHGAVVRWEDVRGRNVVFELPPERTVLMRCIDERGRGVRARVRIDRSFGSRRLHVANVEVGESGGQTASVRGEGAFVATLAAVQSRSRNSSRPPSVEFEIEATDPVDVEFIVPSSGELIASVIDEAGNPLEGVLVYVKVRDGHAFYETPGVLSDAAGKAVVRGIAPGEVIVYVVTRGRRPFVSRSAFAPGDVRRETIRLTTGGYRVSGKLTGLPESAAPPSEWGSNLVRVGALPEDGMALGSIEIEPSGRFEVDGVPAGRFELHLRQYVRPEQELIVSFDVPDVPVDLGDLDLSSVLATGDAEAAVRLQVIGSAPRSARVKYRHSRWPEWAWVVEEVHAYRPDRVGLEKHITGLVPGSYTFSFSESGEDPQAWDLARSFDLAIDDTADHPARVEVTLRCR